MVAPLVALAKGYAANKAKGYLTSKAEEALGIPKDSIAVATDPIGFGKKVVGDVIKDTVMDRFVEREAIPVEDRSFSSSGSGGGGGGGGGKPRFDEQGISVEAFKRGGKVKSKVNSASRRGDGIAQRGKTKGRYL